MKADSSTPEESAGIAKPPLRNPPAGLLVVVGVLGLVFLFPVGYLVWGAIGLGEDFWGTLRSQQTLRPLRNSLLIASSVACSCLVLGTVLAWLVARTDLVGRRIWRLILALPLVIPSFVGATAILSAFGRGGLVPFVPRVEGFWGAFLVLTFLSYPYVYLPVLSRLSTTLPAMEESALLLGSGHGRTILRVVLPHIRESVLAGTMLVFLYGLSDFGAVALMRYDTLTRAIFSARLFDRATSLLLGLVLAGLALVVAGIERKSVPGQRRAPGIGRDQVCYRLGRWRLPSLVLVMMTGGVALAAPLAVFLFWVIRGSSTIGVGYSGITDGLGFLVGPVLNSALASLVAGVVAVVVTLPVAYAVARCRHCLSDLASASVTSVFALPGLVVALALVFWAISAPGPLAAVYQTFPLLVLAYVLQFGAQSMRSSQAAISALPRGYEDAALTLGVGGRRRFLRIDLPLVMPGLVAGGGLVMLSALKELPATLLLAPIGFQTLSTRIWNAAEDGFFAEVGITSLVLILLSGLLTWLFVMRREFRV
ncbi:MAG: iron ABC transporter permease [bacterium]|nr:iron ABC transporter permease [bacterium]